MGNKREAPMLDKGALFLEQQDEVPDAKEQWERCERGTCAEWHARERKLIVCNGREADVRLTRRIVLMS